MKTPACLLILLFSSLLINAQLGKGQWMVGGVADFSYKNTDINKPSLKEDSKETMYRLLPGAGYFFMNRLCGGVRLHISGADNKENSDAFNFGFFLSSRYDAHTSGIGFSPFIRYYILPAASKINVWGEVSYAYSQERTKTKLFQSSTAPGGLPSVTQSTSDLKYKGHYYSIAAGPALFISPKVSFDIAIGYMRGRVKGPEENSDRIMIGSGFQVFIGK